MKKLGFLIFLMYTNFAYATIGGPIYGQSLLESTLTYDKVGDWFRLLQGDYFKMVYLVLIIAVPAIFALHYMVIGPMFFSHDGKQIKVFSAFNRLIHWIAAVSFLILVPTGLLIIFAAAFGGGEFIIFVKHLHQIGSVMFAIVVLPMFFMWVSKMFLALDDIKWLLIFGGYLSKKRQPIPAGKFNSGQKTWFWLATLGGFLMIFTGGMMYFYDFDMAVLTKTLDAFQINLLRLAAILHNIFGLMMVVMFFVHIYMSMFAIKGSIHSMISGNKSEDEVKIMHSSWYKQLQKEGKI